MRPAPSPLNAAKFCGMLATNAAESLTKSAAKLIFPR